MRVRSFHRKNLEEAIPAISLPPECRRFLSLYLVLTQDGMKTVYKEIRAFFSDLIDRYRDTSQGPEHPFQLNLNIMPVSNPIVRMREGACEPLGKSQPLLTPQKLMEI